MPFNNDLSDALQQQHHAAQFIALAGRHLIPQQADDSNTNMQYLPDQKLLAGNELSNELRLALQLTDLKLGFVDRVGNCNNKISINGKSKQMVFEELKKTLASLGIDVSKFKNELHYEIPTHKLDKGAAFSVNDKKFFQESTFYRHNAEIVLNKIVHTNDKAEPVRVWPHHFDTGTLIPVAHNKKGELSKSIGLGWAIPDSMVDEPYYYLSFWSENPIEGLKKLETLKAGE
ncbi:MAG: hypothetical protein K8R68_00300 [Bacteroidales bacterium]|nr:hypothetical protein [Bacteroidales bacterium]